MIKQKLLLLLWVDELILYCIAWDVGLFTEESEIKGTPQPLGGRYEFVRTLYGEGRQKHTHILKTKTINNITTQQQQLQQQTPTTTT